MEDDLHLRNRSEPDSFSPEKNKINKKFLSNASSNISINQGLSSLLLKKSTSQSQYHGLSDFHSSSTLQHSTIMLGFPKAQRFPKIQNISEMLAPIDLPSSLSNHSTTLGYGSKIQMSELRSKEYKDFPAPNHYPIKSDFPPDLKKGKTFGLSHAAYAKIYLPNLNYQSPDMAKNFPGPGQYNVDEEIGSKKKKSTLKSRVKWFTEENLSEAPPSNYYSPVRSLVEPSRFKNISIGYGERSSLAKINDFVPGPGAYKLPSVFDRYGEIRSTKVLKSPKYRRTNFATDDETP